MTFVSVAQATRRLGIDAKTLRRWLADAQLALQSHPHDGRKKGVSAEELHLLAHRHQRSLTPLTQEPPAPGADELPALGAVLLALPGRAAAVQVGDQAPDFKLPATTGGEIRLSDFRGKQMVLIEFYHADFGPT